MSNRQALLAIGETFEFIIMSLIRSKFPESIILHDIHLYSYYLNAITQIDIIVICRNGVFVIEAKNWKHWIKGDYEDFKWTGLTDNRKVIEVFNTYNQNLIHIRELRNAIRRNGWEPVEFHNLIVIPDGTTIQSNCSEIVSLHQMCEIIKMTKTDCEVNKEEVATQINAVAST